MTPSKYQQAVFDWAAAAARAPGKRHALVVNAVAGSGKTTTIVETAKRLPEIDSALFLAFNKRIVLELEKRLPKTVATMTMNALGHRTLGSAGLRQRLQVDTRKTYKVLDGLNLRNVDEAAAGLVKLQGLAKANGWFPEEVDPSAWDDLMEAYNVDIPMAPSQVAEISERLLAAGPAYTKQYGVIDFDDQLWLSVLWDCPFDQYDWVFVDEAQDLSPIQHMVLERLLLFGGNLIAVGDRNQAIYGFRGADANSIDRLVETFGCDELPLSICYRCGGNIVKQAQRYVPHIQPAPAAQPGVVKTLPALPPPAALRPTDAVVCRYNAPLIAQAYELLAGGMACTVLGRDIGAGMIKVIRKMKAGSIQELFEKLKTYQAYETQRLLNKGLDGKVESLHDQLESIRILATTSETVDQLVRRIDSMFSEADGTARKQVLTLMTIHKAKGLEYPRVFILEVLPFKRKCNAAQETQELNLRYVAVTRAETELYYVQPQGGIDG